MSDSDHSIVDIVKQHVAKIKKQPFVKPRDTTFAWLAANGTSPFRIGSNLVFTESGLSQATTYSLPNPQTGSTDTIVTNTGSGTITNKIISASNNSFYGVQQSPLVMRYGEVQALPTATAGNSEGMDGAFGKHTHVGAGGIVPNRDTTEGVFIGYTSGAVAGNAAGVQAPTTAIGMLTADAFCHVVARFKAVQTTTTRVWCGFTNNTTLFSTDTFLAAGDKGLGVGYIVGGAWSIFNNDASGAATVTACTGTTAQDTNWHTVDMNWPAGHMENAQIVVDGNVQAALPNSKVPGTGVPLVFHCLAETSGPAIIFNLKALQIEISK